MREGKFILIGLLLIGLSTMTSAQKIKLVSGSLDFMKEITELKLEFDYSDMSVGKFKEEADYIEKKKKEYNEKEPGRGEIWEKAWVDDRENRFEPRFAEEMNEEFKKRKQDVKAGRNIEAKYTLIFKTTFTEPGFNVGVMRRDAFINGEAVFVESANPENVIATITIDKAPGRFGNAWTGYYDYDTGVRIQEAYAMAGQEMTYYIWKKFMK